MIDELRLAVLLVAVVGFAFGLVLGVFLGGLRERRALDRDLRRRVRYFRFRLRREAARPCRVCADRERARRLLS